MLKFTAEDHKYQSLEPDGIEWLSATSIVSFFKQPFDPIGQSEKSCKNKRSKWYGMTPEEIREAWLREAKRATDLGTWYHNCREKDLCALESLGYKGWELPIIRPSEDKGIKYAQSQRLNAGVYPELLVFLKSMEACGQSDKVIIYDNTVDISDYKTNKEIKTAGYRSWDGIVQKMKAPLRHLDDCHLTHYTLQLSMYMYMILKHNPGLKPGELTIHHIRFEEAGQDKFGYPITALDSNGDPIVKDIEYHKRPYLKDEVITMMNYAKMNKKEILAYKQAA